MSSARLATSGTGMDAGAGFSAAGAGGALAGAGPAGSACPHAVERPADVPRATSKASIGSTRAVVAGRDRRDPGRAASADCWSDMEYRWR